MLRSPSLCDAIQKAIAEYLTKTKQSEPRDDRALAQAICIRIEDYFIERIIKLLKRPDADSIRAFSAIWNRLTGDDT